MRAHVSLCALGMCAFLAHVTYASAPQKKAPGGDFSIPQIARAAKPSVGMIIVSDNTDTAKTIGSCFVVTTAGLVVTNYHIVSDGTSALVKFPNGAFFGVKGVVAADAERDLALLQLDGFDFTPVKLASADAVTVGEPVIAIGNPAELEYTVSDGIVSALRRSTQATPPLIQITAPIAHGSSGGPLFNMRGEVIGVTTLMHTEAQNANFAVAISQVRVLMKAARAPVELSEIATVTFSETVPLNSPAPLSKETPLPRNWVSLQSGADFRLLRDGKYLYLEYLTDDDSKFLCELTSSKGFWTGVCRWQQTLACPEAAKLCKLEQPYTLRFVTPSRIEATIDMPTFECGKGCSIVRTDRRSVTLIPKE